MLFKTQSSPSASPPLRLFLHKAPSVPPSCGFSFRNYLSFLFVVFFLFCLWLPQKLRCCRSMVHSVLVNKSKSSSEKSTGLSKELCRLGDRQASPAKKARSESADEDEEAAGGAHEEEVMEESRCSE